MSRHHAGFAAVTALLVGSTFALAAHAAALPIHGQLQINLGHGWTSYATAPLFAAQSIAPGWSDAAAFGVRNQSAESGALTLTATGISDGTGRLGHDLRFTVSVDRGSSQGTATDLGWTGSVYQLTSPLTLATSMPAGATWRVRVSAELPVATGNADQGDELRFGIELRLQGQTAEVAGISDVRAGTHNGGGPHGLLSLTGEPLTLLLLGALLALVSGTAMLRAGRSCP